MEITPEILKLDLYDILGVDEDSSDSQVKSRYRRRALECHPDRNPDDPKAAEKFHLLSKALEVLLDSAARGAYDKVIKARKAAAERAQFLDANRKRFKEDLDRREREVVTDAHLCASAEEKLAAEIARLNAEGTRLLEEERERLDQLVREEKRKRKEGPPGAEPVQLRVKWQPRSAEGRYTEEKLLQIFSKYGAVNAVALSSKKPGRAVVEFSSPDDAVRAHESEIGFASCPLSLSWLAGVPPPVNRSSGHPCGDLDDDYESKVLQRLAAVQSEKEARGEESLDSSGIESLSFTSFQSDFDRKKKREEERSRMAEEIERDEAGL